MRVDLEDFAIRECAIERVVDVVRVFVGVEVRGAVNSAAIAVVEHAAVVDDRVVASSEPDGRDRPCYRPRVRALALSIAIATHAHADSNDIISRPLTLPRHHLHARLALEYTLEHRM